MPHTKKRRVAERRRKTAKAKPPTTSSIEIYVQPGKFGRHAQSSYPVTAWAAHITDDATAAWKCALKHWFPVRPNGVILYAEARSVTLEQLEKHRYKATLDFSVLEQGAHELKRHVQLNIQE